MYFPLEVGNEWQFRVYYDGGQEQLPYGYAVVADTVLEGHRYFVLRTCWVVALDGRTECTDDSGSPLSNELVRHDDVHPLVVLRVPTSPTGPFDRWWRAVPCALNAPFDTYPANCTHPSALQEYWTGGATTTSTSSRPTL